MSLGLDDSTPLVKASALRLSDAGLRAASNASFATESGAGSQVSAGGRSSSAASGGFNNYGTIVTQDPAAFVDLIEKKKRRANALAGIGGVTS